jgi:hypothetical protein
MANQEELVLKQFAAARQKLGQQQKAGLDEVEASQNRQRAITGLSGGAAMKADQKARKAFVEASSGAEADLAANEAAALQNVKAQEEQRAFQTSERLGGQEFAGTQADLQRKYGTSERLGGQEFAGLQAELQRAYGTQERLGGQEFASTEAGKGREFQASQADIERAIQQEQFGKTYGLQEQQFKESQKQFAEQMKYQWQEFNENVRTNLLNAAAAMKKAGIGSTIDAAKFLNIVNYFRR